MGCVVISEKKFEKIKKQISENENKKIIFSSDDDELNRKVLEKLDVDVLLISLAGRKDFQKQRNSGFNHVLAKIAKKNNVKIGINIDEVIDSRGKNRAEILARIRQNIKICNKNKLQMFFVSPSGKFKKDIHDMKSLGLVLGMPTWMASDFAREAVNPMTSEIGRGGFKQTFFN